MSISDVPEERNEVIDNDDGENNNEDAENIDNNVNDDDKDDNGNGSVLSRMSVAEDIDNDVVEVKSPEPLQSAFKPTNRVS